MTEVSRFPGKPLELLVQQLESSQWFSADRMARVQIDRLNRVSQHAAQHSAIFQRQLDRAGLGKAELVGGEGLGRLPILTRRAVQEAGNTLFCKEMPFEHLPIGETRTSGSTGETVVVRRTAVNQLMWQALTLREHLWHRRDFQGVLVIIRANFPEQRMDSQASWGPPVSLFFESGPCHAMRLDTDTKEQMRWLQKWNPHYLLTYPTNLVALVEEARKSGVALSRLRQIRTIGETVSDEQRRLVREGFGVEIADVYSSQEVGIIAAQCPQSGLYHIMAESLIVEVLNEKGEHCQPGEVGSVVVTDLHNFATPLIRYAIGDYAEVGPPCPCGRGLPTLKRIMGRERNMVLFPDGRRHWPLLGAHYFGDIAPIRQYQAIQHTRESIEVRLVSEVALSAAQEAKLGELIQRTLGYPFQLQFNYFNDSIPRGSGGKFEEYICRAT